MSAWMMRAMCSLTSCVPLLSFATISETVPAASNSAGVTRFMCTMAVRTARSASQPVPAKTSPCTVASASRRPKGKAARFTGTVPVPVQSAARAQTPD